MRALALAACLACACAPPRDRWSPPPALDPASLYAPHRSVGAFFNPWDPQPRRLGDALRWWLAPNEFERSAAPRVPRLPNDGASLAGAARSAEITWVGHATFAVHDEADVFLTDPHFSDWALLARRRTPPGIPIGSVPAHAFAVVSHNHYDHLDETTVKRLPASVEWYVPLGLGRWFHERGRRAVELDWWQSTRRGRWTVTCLPSQHWSRRLGQGLNETLWCSWLLDSGLRRYYFAGDTGMFHGFAEYRRRFAPIDVAMLPIGAYAPRWFMAYPHMDPAEAWRAFEELGARWLLPMHWGSFELTDEPIDLPPVELARAVRAAGGDASRVRLLAVGERWHLPEPVPARAAPGS